LDWSSDKDDTFGLA